MRSHLLKCLENKKMEQFPSLEKRALPPVKKEMIQLCCKCKMPEGKENMAFCPKCREWYHQECEQIPNFIFENKHSKYICSRCC